MLKMADDLIQPIKDGLKTVTIRNGRREITEGLLSIESVSGTEILTVNVKRVEVEPLKAVSFWALRGEGLIDLEGLLEVMLRFYPNITEDSEVTAIEFVRI
jgi:hypothetical protein